MFGCDSNFTMAKNFALAIISKCDAITCSVVLLKGCEHFLFFGCRGKLPQVPWVVGYSQKLLDMPSLLQWHMLGRLHTSYQGATLPLTN
jgi:hypothetical protein